MFLKSALHKKFFHRDGFTIVELLIVITIIGLIAGSALFYVIYSQANQSLVASSERFADHLREAHIFAREAKSQKAWGIERVDDDTYALVNGAPGSWTEVNQYLLEKNTKFASGHFQINFSIGDGYTTALYNVVLENYIGNQIQVTIYPTGIVEIDAI